MNCIPMKRITNDNINIKMIDRRNHNKSNNNNNVLLLSNGSHNPSFNDTRSSVVSTNSKKSKQYDDDKISWARLVPLYE